MFPKTQNNNWKVAIVVDVRIDHFLKAAREIGRSGDNDTLPFDIDAAFIRDKSEDLSQICFNLFTHIDSMTAKEAVKFMNTITIGSERLLAGCGKKVEA